MQLGIDVLGCEVVFSENPSRILRRSRCCAHGHAELGSRHAAFKAKVPKLSNGSRCLFKRVAKPGTNSATVLHCFAKALYVEQRVLERNAENVSNPCCLRSIKPELRQRRGSQCRTRCHVRTSTSSENERRPASRKHLVDRQASLREVLHSRRGFCGGVFGRCP